MEIPLSSISENWMSKEPESFLPSLWSKVIHSFILSVSDLVCICLFVCLSVCLFVCLSLSLSAPVSVCLPDCLSACLSVSLLPPLSLSLFLTLSPSKILFLCFPTNSSQLYQTWKYLPVDNDYNQNNTESKQAIPKAIPPLSDLLAEFNKKSEHKHINRKSSENSDWTQKISQLLFGCTTSSKRARCPHELDNTCLHDE